MRLIFILACALAFSFGCEDLGTSDSSHADASGNGDTSGQDDSSSEDSGEADEDGSGDGGGNIELQAACGSAETAAPGADSELGSCYQQELKCGDVITDTTVGGAQGFSYATYESWFCLGYPGIARNYDAPERSYYFHHPEDINKVTLRLTTPEECEGELSLRAIWVDDAEECISASDDKPGDCTAAFSGDDGSDYIDNTYPDYQYRLIVDGLDGAQGDFTLSVECE